MDRQVKKGRARGRKTSAGFADIRRAVVRRVKVVAGLPVLAAACAAAILAAVPDHYDASIIVQVDPGQRPASAGAMPEGDRERRAIEAEIEAVRAAPVIRAVISELRLGDDPEFAPGPLSALLARLTSADAERGLAARVGRRLSAARIRNTLLLDIRFSSAEREKSARIANAVAKAYLRTKTPPPSRTAEQPGKPPSASDLVFASLVAKYAPGPQMTRARIVDDAEPPRAPAGPKRKRIVLEVFASALLAAAGLAFLLEMKRGTRQKRREIERALACRHMASLPPAGPRDDGGESRALRLMLAEPSGAYALAVREAADELLRQGAGASASLIVVMSPVAGEGAELFASNVAHQLAICGHSTLLADCDLTAKSLTRRLAGQAPGGLLDQIASGAPVERAILKDATTALNFLPASGPAPIPLSAGIALRSPVFGEAVARLKRQFSTIIVAAPPLLPETEAQLLADVADRIVLVTAWQRTPRRVARAALASLGANQCKVAGAVLTDIAKDDGVSVMSFAEILAEIREARPLAGLRDRAA